MKIINFEKAYKKKIKGSKEDSFLKIGDEIDNVITKWLCNSDLDAKDIAGILAHRLGSFLDCVESKEQLWKLCESILKKQAKLS